jgi:hypothetical protein
VILLEPHVGAEHLRRRTGWEIKPEGACKGAVCMPLPADAERGGQIDAHVLADRLQMPLVHDERHGLWALGPESLSGRALTSASVPELVLPDLSGRLYSLDSLRGQKVVLTAWASW